MIMFNVFTLVSSKPKALKTAPAELLALPFEHKSDAAVTAAAAAAAAGLAGAEKDQDRSLVEAGDLLVQELSYTAIKAVPECLSVGDAWRLGACASCPR